MNNEYIIYNNKGEIIKSTTLGTIDDYNHLFGELNKGTLMGQKVTKGKSAGLGNRTTYVFKYKGKYWEIIYENNEPLTFYPVNAKSTANYSSYSNIPVIS